MRDQRARSEFVSRKHVFSRSQCSASPELVVLLCSTLVVIMTHEVTVSGKRSWTRLTRIASVTVEGDSGEASRLNEKGVVEDGRGATADNQEAGTSSDRWGINEMTIQSTAAERDPWWGPGVLLGAGTNISVSSSTGGGAGKYEEKWSSSTGGDVGKHEDGWTVWTKTEETGLETDGRAWWESSWWWWDNSGWNARWYDGWQSYPPWGQSQWSRPTTVEAIQNRDFGPPPTWLGFLIIWISIVRT